MTRLNRATSERERERERELEPRSRPLIGRFGARSGARAGRAAPVVLAVVVGLVLGAVGVAIDRDSRAPDGDNPIVIENRRPGAVGWRLGIDEAAIGPSVGDDDVLGAGTPVPESDSGGPGLVPRAAPTPWVSLNAIEGYTGAQSINRGQPVSLHVSSGSATFDVRVYRQGWYGGAGATQVWTASAIAGVARPLPVATATGRIEAAWPVSLTIPGSVTGGWASGVYLAGLYPAGSSSVSSFIPFVVRDDARTAEILYVLPTTTWQAYNGWGGKSMYAFNSQNDVPATEVSFDRPYATNAGTGLYLGTDVTMVRFLEREGYDVKYVASVDLESRPANLLSSFGTLLTTWHDEYHSAAMRGTVVAARDAGRDLAYFTGNSIYWSITWQPSSTPSGGVANRVIARGRQWRQLGQPENQILGTIFDQFPLPYGQSAPWVVTSSGHPLYGGTGLRDGDTIPNLVGHEFDFDNPAFAGARPAGVQLLSRSPVQVGSAHRLQEASIYRAASGSYVFNASTMYWTYLVDGFDATSAPGVSHPADTRVQQMTRNVLALMAGRPPPPPLPTTTTTVPASTTTTTTVPATTTTQPSSTTTSSSRGPSPPSPPSPPGPGNITTAPAGAAGPPPPGPVTPTAALVAGGYWMLGSDGSVHAFGAARSFGDLSGDGGRSATVDIEATPARAGYWLLDEVGGVHAFGDALDLGDGALSAEQVRRGERFTALSSTPTGKGYWLFTNRGRVVNVGDAGHFGDVSHLSLNGPVLGSIATPTGAGYSLVASDGGIFAFGDAPFLGSVGDRILNAPVRSHVPTPTNRGYWLVASDGGIFAFGDAGFRGSVPGVLRSGQALNAPIVGMVRYGDGYLMVASDGGIFSFSSSPFAGSLADTPPSHAIVAVAAVI